jgi:hypothetical protein
MLNKIGVVLLVILCLCSCSDNTKTEPPASKLQLTELAIGSYKLGLQPSDKNVSAPSGEAITAIFSAPLSEASLEQGVLLKIKTSGEVVPVTASLSVDQKGFSALPVGGLKPNVTYVLELTDELRGTDGEIFPGIIVEFTTVPGKLEITALTIGGKDALNANRIVNVAAENSQIEITFSDEVDMSTAISENFIVSRNNITIPSVLSPSEDNRKIALSIDQPLDDLARYQFVILPQVKGAQGQTFEKYSRVFYTGEDALLDFQQVTDDELLTLVQQQTFKYFWDFAQSSSGMARERNTSGDLVTTGGSGFGIMSIIVAIERNFISRPQGLERLGKILTFLESADRFHGAWPHWINGNSGKVIPFSPEDNGGDLVETSFLIEGLVTFRQYLNPNSPEEQILINRINELWQSVEWDWYTQGGQNVLYWHWSPDKEWIMNHQIKGYNECLITYVLAASSPTHSIDQLVYHNGWASNGGMKNGKSFYDLTLPLGPDYGGPLFFAHYSYLGLDPRNLNDTYANYWTQNVNHSLINYSYCVDNPKDFVGYSEDNWGLTASDNQDGYNAHSPTNDLGVITPTAALSSFPYTPEQSMDALRFFYYKVGDRLWGPYGFYDAFSLTESWTASSYLAIDQGPIIVMIENYRTSLLWDLFMSAPEVQNGLDKLGFTY